MSEPDRPDTSDPDLDLAALLRAAGSRGEPSAVATAQVRAAVEAEWRSVTSARRRRRRYTFVAAAAGVAIAAVGVWFARPLYLPAGQPVAALVRVDGSAEWRSGGHDRWRPLAAGTSLQGGDEVRTGAAGRVAVRLDSGVDVRLDTGTRIAFEDAHHAVLTHGGVYVDSGVSESDPSRALDLDTPLGTVRHLGTQYEARMVGDALRLAVREGSVAVDTEGPDVVGAAGECLTISDRKVERTALAPSDDAWAWVGSVTPPFDIEGRSLDSFLAWAARQTGRQVVYASPDIARRAGHIVLKGSVAGLTPDQALTAVMSTTALRPAIGRAHIRVEGAGAAPGADAPK